MIQKRGNCAAAGPLVNMPMDFVDAIEANFIYMSS